MKLFEENYKKKQAIFTYIVFICNGMLALSIGSLMPLISDARGLDYKTCGILVSLHSVGNFISSFFAGALAEKIGRKRSILIFNSFFALSYLIILLSGNIPLLVMAFLMTGLARGATSNFCNTVINNLAPGKAGLINGLHAMFSVGAFLFPILLMLFTASGDENWIYASMFMFAVGLISWLLYFFIPMDGLAIPKKEKKAGNYGFFKEPLFYLCIVTLFFYLCAEQGVIGWLVTYFKDTGLLNPELSQLMASMQWIMMLAGRLLVAWLSTRVAKEKLLPVMGIGLVLFFLILINSESVGMIVFGIMGFGFSMAGIYPTTVSFSGKLIQKYSLAWSFILTFASFGSILMPTIIGAIAGTYGIFVGMCSVGVVIAMDLVCMLILVRHVKRKEKIKES